MAAIELTNESILALVTTVLPLVTSAITAIRGAKGDPSYQPTDSEILAELQGALDKGDAEWQAWKAAHPPAAGSSGT